MCIRIYTLILYYFTNNLTNYNNLHRLQEIILSHIESIYENFSLRKIQRNILKYTQIIPTFTLLFDLLTIRNKLTKETRVIPSLVELFPIIKLTKQSFYLKRYANNHSQIYFLFRSRIRTCSAGEAGDAAEQRLAGRTGRFIGPVNSAEQFGGRASSARLW